MEKFTSIQQFVEAVPDVEEQLLVINNGLKALEHERVRVRRTPLQVAQSMKSELIAKGLGHLFSH